RAAAQLADPLWLEGGGFLLERDVSVTRFDPASTLDGTVLARPFTDAATGRRSQNVLNAGTATAGSVVIRNATKLYGAEANAAARADEMGPLEAVFVGYRYLCLNEQFTVNDRNTAQVGGLAFFNGLPVLEGDTRL